MQSSAFPKDLHHSVSDPDLNVRLPGIKRKLLIKLVLTCDIPPLDHAHLSEANECTNREQDGGKRKRSSRHFRQWQIRPTRLRAASARLLKPRQLVPVQVDKHCASLWFDDGNIVLSAPSEVTANLTVHFCVHAGVLRRHSQGLRGHAGYPSGTSELIIGRRELWWPAAGSHDRLV